MSHVKTTDADSTSQKERN